jgi:flavin-dependent dehydrogenase
VRRSELDEILFRHAASCGATTLEGARVGAVAFDTEGATVSADVTGPEGGRSTRQWRARFVVDASGRDTLLARQMGLRQRNAVHNSSALFGHFRGSRRLPGRREGNISIFWFDHGWFWFIPLADGTDSVGAVCWPGYLKSRDKPLKEFFLDTIALCPALEERIRGATLEGDRVHATGNYCYSATSCSGPRWLIVGDAFAFIDPVFSTGVYLAMQGAFGAATTVATALDRPDEYEAARVRFEEAMRFGPREYTWFIVRMTTASIRHLFMHPSNPMRVYEAMMSLLAGDIFGRTPIWNSLRAFKGIYYAVSLRHPLRTAREWRRRRAQIRDEGPLRGETIVSAD